MFTVETKSMLAKLMATENIKVEHRVCKTASFNLKTRTLTCPIWTNMSGDLYDLLMGHEISHAKNTPMNGWHDSVVYAGGDKKASAAAQKAFKNFLNVVEDARIEKLIKRTYPGLRQPMIRAYKELVAKDFFGLSAISNFNELYLIDRLNLAAKCGSALNIKFSKKEQPLYNEMMALETWEEVVALAKKLYKHSVEEQKEGEQKKKELADELKNSLSADDEEEGDEGEDSDYDEDYDEDDSEDRERSEGESDDLDSEDEEKDSMNKAKDSDSDEGEDSDSEGEDAKNDEEEKADDKTTEKSKDDGDGKRSKETDKKADANGENSQGAGQQENSEEFIPKAKSDESFRNMEQKLIENSNVVPMDVIIPTPKLKDLVAPAEIVNKGLTAFYGAQRNLGVQMLNEFKKKNEDYISMLAKEFEMKKAARSYAKAKISDSGDININKLATYKLEDHMFKKLMIVHKGKSHGLVLILDKSGSMTEHIEAAMEQILVMTLFCRKVNIPFAAYSFTDSSGMSKEHDFPGRSYSNDPLKPFSTEEGEMKMGNIDLREMFNSRMPAYEFTQAITNHLMLVKAFTRGYHIDNIGAPSHERMGSTPLNEALVALRDIIRNFKKAHRLDIVNAIVVHDGDSDGNREVCKGNSKNYSWNSQRFDPNYNRVTLIDQKEHLHIDVPKDGRGITIALMKWIQMTAHCGVFGFYITGSTPKSARRGIMGLYQNKQGIKMKTNGFSDKPASVDQGILLDKLSKEVIENKFLESYTDGYTRFYFIPGSSELRTSNSGLVDNGTKWTPHRLLVAFKKVHQKRRVSRVLVNRFIELMSV